MREERKEVTRRPAQPYQNHARARLRLFAALAVLLLLVVVFAEQLCPYDPYAQDLSISLQAPSLAHLFGTDIYGRDLLSRVLIGLQTSVLSTLLLIFSITVVGTGAGVLSGYLGGVADTALMRVADLCLAFPGLVFAMAIAALLEGGIGNAVLALAVISWPKYARIARSQTLSLKNTEFIQAARLAGSSSTQVIGRHILPNILGPILITSMLDIGTMLMEIAGLSYLGLGAQAPTAELGSMMSAGRSMLQTYPWVVLAPGCMIFVTVVIFNLLGDALRDFMDTRGKR